MKTLHVYLQHLCHARLQVQCGHDCSTLVDSVWFTRGCIPTGLRGRWAPSAAFRHAEAVKPAEVGYNTTSWYQETGVPSVLVLDCREVNHCYPPIFVLKYRKNLYIKI
jgi:hypothetical protein